MSVLGNGCSLSILGCFLLSSLCHASPRFAQDGKLVLGSAEEGNGFSRSHSAMPRTLPTNDAGVHLSVYDRVLLEKLGQVENQYEMSKKREGTLAKQLEAAQSELEVAREERNSAQHTLHALEVFYWYTKLLIIGAILCVLAIRNHSYIRKLTSERIPQFSRGWLGYCSSKDTSASRRQVLRRGPLDSKHSDIMLEQVVMNCASTSKATDVQLLLDCKQLASLSDMQLEKLFEDIREVYTGELSEKQLKELLQDAQMGCAANHHDDDANDKVLQKEHRSAPDLTFSHQHSDMPC